MVRYDKFNKQDNLLARRQLERAIELEPLYAKAIAKKAWTYLQDHWNEYEEDSAKSLRLAKETAESAIAADPGEPDAHQALGSVRLFLRQHDLAIDSYRKAVELNPNGADLMVGLGFALTYSGFPDEGLQAMGEAISRNPYYPGWYLWDFAWGYFVIHRYEDAIKALEKRNPKTSFTHLMLAVNYAEVGRQKRSAESMKVFRDAVPDYSIETAARTEPFKNDEDLQHYLEALRKVGIPEKPPEK